MKTNIKNFGMAILFSIAMMVVTASEFKNNLKAYPEPVLEMEAWMTNYALFNAPAFDSGSSTVVEIAVANANFSILVEALTKAELTEALSTDGPFTVFAPTNAAFESLFSQLGVNGIGDLSKEQLTPILTYHVVSGKIKSTDLTNTSVATLNGKMIKVDLNEGVKINESKVVSADISGKNGVIHVIDKVLLPK